MADKRQIPDRIKYIYEAADDYKIIYVNGAAGGATSNSELKFDFYQEYLPVPEFSVRPIEANRLGEEIETSGDKTEVEMIRERKVGIVMSLEKAKLIGNWMIRTVEEFEKKRDDIMRQEEGEVDSDGTANVTDDTV